MVDLVNSVTTVYSVSGLEDSLSRIERITAAEQRLAAQSNGLSSATAGLDRSTLSAARGLDSFTRGLDPLSKAMATYERGLTLANRATAQGIPITAENARALANAKARVDELSHAANDNAKALHEHTNATSLNRMQQMELMHVSKSLFDELASGQGIIRALTVEGGRIGEIFAEGSGGVGGTLEAIGGTIAGMLSPTILLTGGMVALGVAAVYATMSWESSQEKLAMSMEGVGRRADETLAQVNAVAVAGAHAGGLSISQGQDLAAQYTRAGLDGGTAQSLIGSTRAYARFSGSSVSDAGGALAGALADPAKGLSELDKQLGFVSGRLRSEVQDLEAQGQLQAAQRLAVQAFNDAMSHVTDTTWGASRAFDAVKIAVSDAFGKVGHAIDNAIFGPPKTKTPEEAAADARQANAISNSGLADAAVRSILPDLVKAQTSSNTIALLKTALSDQAVLDNMKMLPGQTQQAYGNAVVMQANASPALRTRQDYELSLAAADAFSTAEKAAVEARRAELAVLHENGDLIRAQAAAQRAVNEAVAKANSEADDYLTKAKENRGLVGLSPYERGLQEIKNRYEGDGGLFDKAAASRSDITDAMKPVAADLRTAGQEIANAIRQAAAMIAPTPGSAAGAFGTLAGVKFGGTSSFGLSGPNIATPDMISDAAARTGVPAAIIAAIGKIENGGRLTGGTTMLGSDGRPSSAWGYGQLTNGAAADVARAVPGFSKYDPSTAVFGSAEYLSILAQRNHGDLTAALNAYGGTPDYASKVLSTAGTGRPLTISAANQNVAPITSTALGSYKQSEGLDVGGYNQQQIEGPLKAANQALQDQIGLLAAQKSSVGQSAAAIQAAAKAQDLLNTYTNADPNHKLGAAAWDQITAGVSKYKDSLQATLQAQQDFQKQQQQIIGALDGVRSAASQGLGTFVDDLMKGKSAGTAIRDVMHGLGEDLIKLGEHSLIDSLFGKSGQAGGGLFGGGLGGIFSSLFGGFGGLHFAATGTSDSSGGPTVVGENGPELLNLPRHAQVVPNGSMRSAMAAAGDGASADHTFNFGDVHIHPVGGAQFTPDQVQAIRGQVVQGQQETVTHITRNLQSISAKNERYAA